MAATKDIAGRTLKIGDQVLVPALVPAKVTSIGADGTVGVKTDKPMSGGANELTTLAGQCQKWTPPGAGGGGGR